MKAEEEKKVLNAYWDVGRNRRKRKKVSKLERTEKKKKSSYFFSL
jgi:hypothetical protein